jgi:hypothetical protein
MAEETGEQQRDRRALDQRWHELLSRESQFRSLPCESAATG